MAFRTVIHLILAVIGVLLSCQGALATVTITANSDPPPTTRYLEPGSKLTLACKSDKTDKVTWTHENQNELTTVVEDATKVPLIQIAPNNELVFNNLGGLQGGKYICDDGSDKKEHWVEVLDRESLIPRNNHTIGTLDRVTLRCDQRFQTAVPLIWIRVVESNTTEGGRVARILNVQPENDKTYTVEAADKGYALTIRNAQRKRYPQKKGYYFCRLNNTGNAADIAVGAPGAIENKVMYDSDPDVIIDGVSTARTKSATKDGPFTLKCSHNTNDSAAYLMWEYGNATANSSLNTEPFHSLPVCATDLTKRCYNGWTFSSNVIDPNNRTHLKEENQYEETLVLEFDSVREDQHGKYTCILMMNGLEVNRADVDLKVKDKLAALWPFLGIVAEVVILCAIIFIYEKRRNKTVDEEDENEPMKGDNHETRDAGVRSRK